MYEIFLRLLNEKGLTVADVSRATGISQSTMSNWKIRNNILSPKYLKKVADFFGVSTDYLLGTETEHESTTGKKYYFSDETAEAAQELFDDPDLHALFSMAKDSGPDNVRFVTEMLRRLKDTNPEG